MSGLKEVQLVSTGVYLPGEPVPFDKIEEVLGRFDQASPKTKIMIERLRPMAKKLIGVEQCYFAVDPKTRKLTESNTSMAVKAAKKALAKADMKPAEIDCILYGNLMPDHQTPPTSTFIQQELGIERCAEIEVHSNCTGITKLLQIASDAIKAGRYRNILVAYSQLSSAYLLSDNFNQEKVRTESMLLRWFLADGAGVAILKAKDKIDSGFNLAYVYNESVGGKMAPGMWLNLGTPNFNLLTAYKEGAHHFEQNYKMVNDFGPDIFFEGFEKMLRQSGVNGKDVQHVIATLPSKKFLGLGKKVFAERYSIPQEKWYSTIGHKGYNGAATILVALDEMIENKVFRPKDILACITIESSKWMVGGFFLKYS
jgi:3-oxoacyl-[acyl-carrier-protein] synthase III